MNPNRRAGLPDVDPLIDIAEAEQTRLDNAIVVSRAEGVVTEVRQVELVALQAAAWRRLSAAKGRLTRARKDGSAEKIAAAARRVDTAYAEACAVSDDAIEQMQALSSARLDQLGDTMQQMRRSWDAGSAVIDALSRPNPPLTGENSTP